MKKMKRQTVIIAVEKKNGVVQRIGKSVVYQPENKLNGGTVNWYEDLIKQK